MTVLNGRQVPVSMHDLVGWELLADEERAGTSGRFKLDFSGLKRQLTAARSEADRESLHSDFRREIDARVAALAHVAPNLKALEQFQAVKVNTLTPTGSFFAYSDPCQLTFLWPASVKLGHAAPVLLSTASRDHFPGEVICLHNGLYACIFH